MNPSEHVVTSETVEIEAPAAVVWDVLVDYPRYPEWNPFTVEVQTTLEVGTPIELTLPSYDGSGQMLASQETIREVDPPHHLRYDNAGSVPGVLGVRDQWITPSGPIAARTSRPTRSAVSTRTSPSA